MDTEKVVERPLVILPSLRTPAGAPTLTRKFIEGAAAFAARWPGEVQVLIEAAATASDDLDHVRYDAEPRPFSLEVVDYKDPSLAERLSGAAVVLGALGVEQNGIATMCRSVGVPFVPVSEYTLQTRRQIARAESASWRRHVWEAGQELANRRVLAASSGLQANGLPTFRAYEDRVERPLLYFDTRTRASAMADEAAMARRATRLTSGAPLHLAFSGRLNPMKGADHLLEVARHLRDRDVDFRFSIAGGGVLADDMRATLDRYALHDRVRMLGVLDFEAELTPFVRDEVDLYVFCHRQGDPSCTYLETLSCGVPLVGYDNEALAGLVEEAPCGAVTPMDDPAALADRIAELEQDRARLSAWAEAGLAFARTHSFEATMDRRVAHLSEVACAAAALAA